VAGIINKERVAFVAPASHGWSIHAAGAPNGAALRTVESLRDAADAIPPDQEIHLALPCDAALLTRLRFPSTDLGELGGMVRLQLEKTLPYPPEEITSGFDVVESAGQESILVATAVNTGRLEALCQPLRDSARLPARVTVFVLHVAATCPRDEIVFLVYKENGKLVAALCEKGKPAAVQVFADAAAVVEALPRLLTSAELEDIPTAVSLVRLDTQLAELEEPLCAFFGAPVEFFSPDAQAPPASRADLLPASWKKESLRIVRLQQLRERLLLAVAVYGAFILMALLYLVILKAKVHSVDGKLDVLRPQLVFIHARQIRWNALSPAVDPSRFLIELLYQIDKSRPADSVRVTSFHATGSEFLLDGEAPTASMAIRFGDLLRKNPELARFKFDIPAPRILPNGHAQIRIAGKS